MVLRCGVARESSAYNLLSSVFFLFEKRGKGRQSGCELGFYFIPRRLNRQPIPEIN